MKTTIFLIAIISTFVSCSNGQKKSEGNLENSLFSIATKNSGGNNSEKFDTIQELKVESNEDNSENNIDEVGTIHGAKIKSSETNALPSESDELAILKLPFGPLGCNSIKRISKATSSFYIDLIRKNNEYSPTYQLPPIDSFTYVLVNTEDQYWHKECSVEKFFSMDKYKYRLPNYKNFNVYYMCDNDGRNNRNFKEESKLCASSNQYLYYGHLILYDSVARKANYLPIYYQLVTDGWDERVFYINKNYEIFLRNRHYFEGDGKDIPSEVINNEYGYEITITDSGTFEIEKKEEK